MRAPGLRQPLVDAEKTDPRRAMCGARRRSLSPRAPAHPALQAGVQRQQRGREGIRLDVQGYKLGIAPWQGGWVKQGGAVSVCEGVGRGEGAVERARWWGRGVPGRHALSCHNHTVVEKRRRRGGVCQVTAVSDQQPSPDVDVLVKQADGKAFPRLRPNCRLRPSSPARPSRSPRYRAQRPRHGT